MLACCVRACLFRRVTKYGVFLGAPQNNGTAVVQADIINPQISLDGATGVNNSAGVWLAGSGVTFTGTIQGGSINAPAANGYGVLSSTPTGPAGNVDLTFSGDSLIKGNAAALEIINNAGGTTNVRVSSGTFDVTGGGSAAVVASGTAGGSSTLITVDGRWTLRAGGLPGGTAAISGLATLVNFGAVDVVSAVTASETIAAGALVNIWNSSGAAKARNASGVDTTKPAHAFALNGATSGQAVYLTAAGVNQIVSGLTVGPLWLSTSTPGGVQSSPPSTSGQGSQPVGIALTSSSFIFQPGAVFGV